MKKFPYLAFFGTWLLVFCGTLGAPLCVVTAYDLPYHPVALILTALIISGFMTLLFTVPELGTYMLIPFGATVLLISIFRWRKLYSGAVVAIRTIQSVLARTIPFISDPGTMPTGVENYAYFIGFFVGAIMVAVALLISWGLVSGESMFLPFLVPMPLVALALIYTDMQPSGWAGVLVGLYYGGVLFTSGLRLHRGGGIGRVTFLALAALFLTVLLLTKIYPKKEYEPLSTQERVEQVMRQAASVWERMNRLFDRDVREREDLTREGELKATGEHVMDVKTSSTGLLYLRGTSYGRYDGRYWSLTSEYADGESLFTLGGSLPDPRQWLEVRGADTSLLYTPYAVVKGAAVPGEVRENYIVADRKLSAYSWAYRSLPDRLVPRMGSEAEQAYAAWAKKTYVTLTKTRREAFQAFLKPYELPGTDDPYALAQAIAAILRGTVEYDLEPGDTPKDQDFALYFLTVSKRGYCVHYASALTALLQAKGVPARFVIGFALTVGEADTWVEVTDRNAHAWTEVYVEGWGWVPIEATGGDDPRLDIPAPEAGPGDEPEQETPPPTVAPEETLGPKDTPKPEETPEPTPKPTPEDTPQGGETTPTPTPEPPQGGAATPTPTPEPEAPEQDPEDSGRSWLLWLLWLLLLPLLVFLYIKLRKRVCRNRMRRILQGDGRKAVLYGYGELLRLVRHGATPSEKAQRLADEAAFSDHILGEKQKKTMAGHVKAAQRELEEKLPRYKLWYLRYLLWLW